MPKQSEVLAARQKWIEFLKNPHRRKLEGKLGNEGGERCCLGHGCYIILGPPKEGAPWNEDMLLPPEAFWKTVGMHDQDGNNPNGTNYGDSKQSSLSSLNDDTDWSPQKIGKFLESVIRGGKNTPFRPISDFKK